jgi:hypothetical protein
VVALADGRLDAAERRMLLRCASWLGLNQLQAEAILAELIKAGRVSTISVPSEPLERERLFNAVINVALANGHLAAQEELCLRNLARPFGVSPEAVARLIERNMRSSKSQRLWPRDWSREAEPHETQTSDRSRPTPSALAPTKKPLRVGMKVSGKFELREVLGSGGFGTVYRARHTDLGEDVALKVLNADLAESDGARERFMREVRITRSFSHRYAVPLREFGRDDQGRLYFTMDLVPGVTLRSIIDEGPLGSERLVRVGAQALEALGEAHRAGIVHRDLKPSNLMLTRIRGEEEVRLLDFGISKAVSAADNVNPALTSPGKLVGTLNYMSPEQVLGRRLDARSDLYTMGLVLYESVCGRMPIPAGEDPEDTDHSFMLRILSGPPVSPSDVVPGISAGLSAVILKALEKSPKDRYDDASSMRRALLESSLESVGEPSARETRSARFGRWIRVQLKRDAGGNETKQL